MLLGRRLYPAYFPPPGPARLSRPLNPVENAEGVDIRRVPLIRQLEPGATQWQMDVRAIPRYGCSGIWVIARAGPVDGPGVPGCAAHSGPSPGAGPMNPSGVRLQSGRPVAGSMNLTGRTWLGHPLKRGGGRTLTKASYLSRRAGPRIGPMNPSEQPKLPSGAGLLRTVEPGAAESSDGRPGPVRGRWT